MHVSQIDSTERVQAQRNLKAMIYQAIRVERTTWNGQPVHAAYYADGTVVITDDNFNQYICVNGQIITATNNYTYETISGISYIKHIYNGGYIYTNASTQFIVVR